MRVKIGVKKVEFQQGDVVNINDHCFLIAYYEVVSKYFLVNLSDATISNGYDRSDLQQELNKHCKELYKAFSCTVTIGGGE